MTTERAHYDSIPLSEGLKLSGAGQLWTEKKDGAWATRSFGINTVIGEQTKDGEFWAFDCVEFLGEDIRKMQWSLRWKILNELYEDRRSPFNIVPSGIGAEFLEAVLARGGEGVVIADLDAPYGTGLTKCKRMATFDLLVTEKHEHKSSIHLGSIAGEDFGWCPCRAAFDQINVGDIVEVEAFGRHSSGKLREPRFIRLRHDK